MYNLLFLSGLCIFTAVANYVFEKSSGSPAWFDYSFAGSIGAASAVATFCLAVLVYQNLVPISLVITVELVKSLQSWLIYQDEQLYYSVTNSACAPRNWNIADDLGQVAHIFSDKTGTLTQNVMQFHKCSVGTGDIYGKTSDECTRNSRKY